jgi:transcriptional regulator with XRE-family HTH domain
MIMVKVSDLETGSQVADELARANPEVRRELERTALANDVAIRIIRYRTEHALSQTQLARQLGLHQSAIARLEAGDHEPSLATLARLAKGLEIGLHIDITPDGRVELQEAEPVSAALSAAPHSDPDIFPSVSPELARLVAPHLVEIKARVAVAEAAHPGKVLTGTQIFPDAPVDARKWDLLAVRNYSVWQLTQAFAVIRAVNAECQDEAQTNRVAS